MKSALTIHADSGSFEARAHAACFALSATDNTRRAYWQDCRKWLEFCAQLGVDPKAPHEDAALMWIEAMRRAGTAPKTRARRVAGLCSIYRRLRKSKVVTWNPFSIEDGPDRETARPLEPTPIASPEVIKKLLATCDATVLGTRDTALIRILWGTGARRASIIAMTFERLRKDRGDYVAQLIGKGNKEVPVLIRGRAAEALTAWLTILRDAKLSSGPIWRSKRCPMTERGLDHMLRRRARLAKVDPVSPHTFRVAFLTYNPAGLEAKQSAAGHASPETTRIYDRKSWRGREAFEAMPEVEDTSE